MSDVETSLRELLDAKAGEMPVDPEIPRAVRRRAGRRRLGTGLAAGALAVALVAGAGAGIRAAIGDRPESLGGGDVTGEWRGIWPQDTRAEAEAAQAAADAGDPDATWQLDARTVIERYGTEVLEWNQVSFEQEPWESDGLVVVIGNCPGVATEGCPFEVDITVERLVRTGPGGIYLVTGVEVITEPEATSQIQTVRRFVVDFMRARNIQAESSLSDMMSPEARAQYDRMEGGLSLFGPTDPAFEGFRFHVRHPRAIGGRRYEVRVGLTELRGGRAVEIGEEHILVGVGHTLRGGPDVPVILEATFVPITLTGT